MALLSRLAGFELNVDVKAGRSRRVGHRYAHRLLKTMPSACRLYIHIISCFTLILFIKTLSVCASHLFIRSFFVVCWI